MRRGNRLPLGPRGHQPDLHPRKLGHFARGRTPNVPGQNFARGALDPKVVQRLGFAFTPDSRSFITTDPDGTLGVWGTRTMQQTESLPTLGSNCWQVALSPDGHWLAVGDAAGKVHIWDWTATPRRHVKSFEVPFEWYGLLRFFHRGGFLLAKVRFNNGASSLKIWRTGGWEELPLRGIRVEVPTAADFSPDDRFLALGYKDGAVTLRSVASRQDETTFGKHTKEVNEVCFSPDGRMLVTTSADGSVKLWDVATRRELATLRGHPAWVCGVTFCGDGRRVATGRQQCERRRDTMGPRDAKRTAHLAGRRTVLPAARLFSRREHLGRNFTRWYGPPLARAVVGGDRGRRERSSDPMNPNRERRERSRLGQEAPLASWQPT